MADKVTKVRLVSEATLVLRRVARVARLMLPSSLN